MMTTLRNHTDAAAMHMNERMASVQEMASSKSTSSEGGSGRKGEPLAVSKVFMDLAKITGEETHQQSDDWYQEVKANIDLVIPSASEVLDWAIAQPTVITHEIRNARTNAVFTSTVSRELYGLLLEKTQGKARTYINHLEANEGLEGWRAIKYNFAKKDVSRLNEEFEKLETLPEFKNSNVHSFGTIQSVGI